MLDETRWAETQIVNTVSFNSGGNARVVRKEMNQLTLWARLICLSSDASQLDCAGSSVQGKTALEKECERRIGWNGDARSQLTYE